MIHRRIISIMCVATLATSQLQAMSTLASLCRFVNNHRKMTMAVVGLAAWGVYAYKKSFFPFARKATAPKASLPENDEIGPKGRGRSLSLDASIFYVHEEKKLDMKPPQPSQNDDLISTRMGGALVGNHKIISDSVVWVGRKPGEDLTKSQLQLVTAPFSVQAKQMAGNGLTFVAHAAENTAHVIQPMLVFCAHKNWESAKNGIAAIVGAVRKRRNSFDNGLSTSFVDLGNSQHAHMPVPVSDTQV